MVSESKQDEPVEARAELDALDRAVFDWATAAASEHGGVAVAQALIKHGAVMLRVSDDSGEGERLALDLLAYAVLDSNPYAGVLLAVTGVGLVAGEPMMVSKASVAVEGGLDADETRYVAACLGRANDHAVRAVMSDPGSLGPQSRQ